jgi:hypothetical protein
MNIISARPTNQAADMGGGGGRMSETFAYRRVIKFPGDFPTGDLSDPEVAAGIRNSLLQATVFKQPTTLVLDLSGKLLSPASLKELVVPLAQVVAGGLYGDVKLVVATADAGVREIVALLATSYQVPLYVADSADDVFRAVPAGILTEADTQTLEEMKIFGSAITVSALASAVGLQPSAANNRLVNVDRKGFVFRVKRGRDEGDLYVDPRVRPGTRLGPTPSRQPLLEAGIVSDPQASPPRHVEGEDAERLDEILSRRKKRS